MQSSKEPISYKNRKSVGSTLHNNLLFITRPAFLVCKGDYLTFRHHGLPPFLKNLIATLHKTEWLCMGFGEIKKPTDSHFENQSAMYN